MRRVMPTVRWWPLVVGLLALACGDDQLRTGDGSDDDYGTRLGDPGASTKYFGQVRVRHLDQPEGTTTQYLLYNEGKRLAILDFETAPDLRTGEIVGVSGEWLSEDTIAVDSFEVVTRDLRRLDGPLVRTPKHHRVAVLAMQEASVTEQQALNDMNGSVDSLRKFYAETSQNIDTFSGDVFRRYSISYTANDCQYDNTDVLADRLIAAFENDGYKASNYDHVAVIVPRSCGSDWSGAWAYIGGINDKGLVNFSLISMYKDNAFDPWFLAHELGHNLGMNHARSMNCGSQAYKPSATGCSFKEYGNYNDPMGNGEGVYFGAAYQRFMGWLGASNIATAGKSGTFNLQPSDGEICGVRAVRIPIPGESGNYFYVEYRRARADSRYAGTGQFGSTRQNSVLITRSGDGLGGNDSSYTDRVELGTTTYLGAKQGVRYDLGNGVAVKVLAMSGTAAQVAVEMPGNGIHRTDGGTQVLVESDGSNGPKSCNNSNDACPSDPNKTDPGICGCGSPDTDSDGDGTANCQDRCPSDSKKVEPGQCGCGTPEGSCGPGSMCVDAPENTTATLTCPSGQTIVSIDFASYGLPTGSCGSGFQASACHAATSQDTVKAACLGKNSCALQASNGVFGDPCGGKAKKLSIIYNCDQLQASGAGLKGAYFNEMNLTGLALERVDSTIDFNWAKGSPDPKIESDTFSVRWTGFVEAKTSGTHTFYTLSDDGIRLWVNNTPIINNWTHHGPTEDLGTISLQAGKRYPIKLEYYENGGGAVAQLLWSSAQFAKQVIPAGQLFSGNDNCPSDPNKTEPGECGCGVPEGSCGSASTLYEAEANTARSGCNLATNHGGYTGSGFMDYGGNGTWIEWNNINVPVAGNYALTFRYASSSQRQSEAIVNGTSRGNVRFPQTGAWTVWGTDVITVPLKAGNNTVRIMANTSSGGPNLDSMQVATP